MKHWTNLSEATKCYGDGQVLRLLTGKADFALAGTAHISLNDSRIEFLMHTDSLRLLAMFRKAEFIRDSFALLRPLSLHLWFGTAFWLLSCMLALEICTRIQASETRDTFLLPRHGTRTTTTNSDSLLWPIAFLCCRGINDLPRENHFRTMALSFSVTAILFNQVYCAELLSFLTVGINPYETAEQLLGTSFKFASSNSPIIEKSLKVVMILFKTAARLISVEKQ